MKRGASMPTKEKLLAEQEWASAKISSQICVLNLGALGTTWSLLISGAVSDKVKITFSEARWILLLCFLGLAFDLGQYLSAYILGEKIRKKMEDQGLKTFEYPATTHEMIKSATTSPG
jgi:hypothetical protein